MSQEEVNESDSPMGNLILNSLIFILFCVLAGHGIFAFMRFMLS